MMLLGSRASLRLPCRGHSHLGASIAEETRAKVLRAAKSLGYRPNLIARSLIKGQSGIIGIVIGNSRNPFFMAALDMLLVRLARLGKHGLVFTMEENTTADMHVNDLLKFRVDAIVLMAATPSLKLAEQCRAERIPLIFFGRRPRYSKDYISVSGTTARVARQLAEHLLLQGYQRIGFIAGREDSSTSREREAGFMGYFKSQGLPRPSERSGISVAMAASRPRDAYSLALLDPMRSFARMTTWPSQRSRLLDTSSGSR